jgi:hypothetical protein
MSWTLKIRPNILIGMVLVATLGIAISYLGYRMGNEGIISAAGVGAIVAISNLAGKILEKE